MKFFTLGLMKVWFAGMTALALLGGALAVGVASQSNGTLASGLRVAGVDVSGMTTPQAVAAVTKQAAAAPQVMVSAGTKTWTVSAEQLGWQANPESSVAAAEQASAERNLLERFQALLGRGKVQEFPLVAQVDAAKAKAALAALTKGLEVQPKNAAVFFDVKTKKYAVKPDVVGRRLDLDSAVNAYAASPFQTSVKVPLSEWKAQFTAPVLQAYANQGNALMRTFTVQLGSTTRKAALSPLQVANLYWVKESGIVTDDKAMQAAFQNLTNLIDQPAQNARYALRGGGFVKIKESVGVVTDRPAAFEVFKTTVMDATKTTAVFPSKVSKPTLTLAQLPDPGKLELIAVGNSTYYHSSPARRTNVANAASKVNGAVVPAGEVFSFLNTLGGITARNGFVGGLIISNGRTVDGLGGGVCQVSTTTFRAMYQAGLPVVERNQHSYRVSYYEPQVGFEAAVYDPGVDLKFLNDTGAPILIKTVNMPGRSALQVQIWGIKPKRSVYVSPAVILSRTPHPPAQYIVNPRLRPGTMNQVDWAQDGYNLYITRTIRDAKGTRTDVTRTFYKPWRAVFEVGPRG